MKTLSSSSSKRTSASHRRSATLLGHTMAARILRRPFSPACLVRAHRRTRRHQALLQQPRRKQALLQRLLPTIRYPGRKKRSHQCTLISGAEKKEKLQETTWSRTERAAPTGSSLRFFCGTSSHMRRWLTAVNAATSCSWAGNLMELESQKRPRIRTICGVA